MAKAIALSLALLCFWLVLSGHFSPFLLAMGALSTGLCVYIAWRMDILDAQSVPTHLRPTLFLYWFWLLVEIIKANLQVARLILAPRPDGAGQQLVLVPTTQKTDMGRVIYANSITLTPGTVTVEVADNAFLVHAITADFVPSLADMDTRVTSIEGTLGIEGKPA
ncbi:MAG: Na+/H+ antiporter subunit E [Pseudomonadota bacterium]